MRKLRFVAVKYWNFQARDCKCKLLRFHDGALDYHRAIYSHLEKNITTDTWLASKMRYFFVPQMSQSLDEFNNSKSFQKSFSVKQKTARLSSNRYADTRHCINLLFTVGELSSFTSCCNEQLFLPNPLLSKDRPVTLWWIKATMKMLIRTFYIVSEKALQKVIDEICLE